MAFESLFRGLTIPAGSDLSSSQFFFMIINSSGRLAIPAGAGDPVDGVLQDKPDAAGVAGALAFDGVSKVEAGAAVSVGDLVQSDAAGKAIPALSGTHAAGKAITAAAADGEVISVLLLPIGELP
jgi:hypothetical protein